MEITIYTGEGCGTCKIIKNKLIAKGLEFTEINDIDKVRDIAMKVGHRNLPLSFVDGKFMPFMEMNRWVNSYGK